MLTKVPSECVLSSKYHSEQERIRIICVGAGAAGLVTAYKAEKMLRNYELIVYDKLVSVLQAFENISTH